jgi:recombination protein RecA
VVKNKVAPPFRQAEFDIIYGEGISKEGCILDLAVENEIIKKSGTWYSYKDEKVGQGRDNAKEFLKENKEILNEIEQRIRKIYNLPSTFEGEEMQQSKSGENEAS